MLDGEIAKMVKVLKSRKISKSKQVFWGLLAVAALVLISPLDIMPLLDDEPIRALVSLEMWLSGNYWVPTTNGELYQNKPPLFNWIVSGLMNLVPNFNEFYLRLPSLLVLLVMTVCIYYFFKKEVKKDIALFTAFGFLTCGRILFVDSMLGYIDPFFSLAVFLNLFFLYKIDVRAYPLPYFLLSYFLCLLAFFFKGIPALVFQVLSLSAALYVRFSLRKLFSLEHLAGILLFGMGLLSYYGVYADYASVDSLFSTLWEQSTKRTLTNYSWSESLMYVAGFPFEFTTHFLPWTLFVFFCFRKDIMQVINHHPFIRYAFVLFIANIWVYWLSPETRPRYLFMLLPFYFVILFYVYAHYASKKQKRIIYRFILTLSILLSLVALVPIFHAALGHVEYPFFKVTFVAISLLFLTVFILRNPKESIPLFVLVLLVVRLGFNFFVLPSRKSEAPESQFKKFGVDIGKMSMSVPLFILDSTPLDNDISYYISSTNHRIVSRRNGNVKEGEYYICQNQQLKDYGLIPVYRFYTNWQHTDLYLAKK
jgi:4-amino-4-deoxy-L-arabinose transferase-like glycosyltransferase